MCVSFEFPFGAHFFVHGFFSLLLLGFFSSCFIYCVWIIFRFWFFIICAAYSCFNKKKFKLHAKIKTKIYKKESNYTQILTNSIASDPIVVVLFHVDEKEEEHSFSVSFLKMEWFLFLFWWNVNALIFFVNPNILRRPCIEVFRFTELSSEHYSNIFIVIIYCSCLNIFAMTLIDANSQNRWLQWLRK